MVSTPDDDVPQCTSCGACCSNNHDARYIELWEVDRARLGDALSTVAIELESRWFLRMTDGQCASLVVADDPTSSVVARCGIYESRPDACRAFERGSMACERARAIDVPLQRLSARSGRR
jgi:Fe-S-cluster containining protein